MIQSLFNSNNLHTETHQTVSLDVEPTVKHIKGFSRCLFLFIHAVITNTLKSILAHFLFSSHSTSVTEYRVGCLNISIPECDFSSRMPISEYGKYTGRVRAQSGAESSAWVESNKIVLDKDSESKLVSVKHHTYMFIYIKKVINKCR